MSNDNEHNDGLPEGIPDDLRKFIKDGINAKAKHEQAEAAIGDCTEALIESGRGSLTETANDMQWLMTELNESEYLTAGGIGYLTNAYLRVRKSALDETEFAPGPDGVSTCEPRVSDSASFGLVDFEGGLGRANGSCILGDLALVSVLMSVRSIIFTRLRRMKGLADICAKQMNGGGPIHHGPSPSLVREAIQGMEVIFHGMEYANVLPTQEILEAMQINESVAVMSDYIEMVEAAIAKSKGG